MNILIPHTWIKDFVSTEAKPKEIADLLSLHSFSVEEIHRTENKDCVYEIEVTPNRHDAMSVLGIARELNVILNQNSIDAQFKDPVADINWSQMGKNIKHPLHLEVQIKDPKLAPRFTAIALKNINVKESPKYIKDRLRKVGIRSLNNVIDITNYLMIERGQPMHAFDYDKIHNGKMILRRSIEGETVTTLDGQTRTLPQGAIIIEDGEKIIDLCGIMGGENSKVDKKTNKIVLFVQIYDPYTIRKTVQKLGFRTEAATRFEKGMDPRGVIPALNQATTFLTEQANGEIANELTDIENSKCEPHNVNISKKKIKEILGISIKLEKVKEILEQLGFQAVINQNVETLETTVPSWRTNDIQITEDLIEEVARIYGYHNLPVKLAHLPPHLPKEEKMFYWEDKIKEALKGWGFTELYSYSFTNANTLGNTYYNEEVLEIENPLTADLSHLRPDLLPRMLEVVEANQAQFKEQKLFQLSRVFRTAIKSETGVNEIRQLILINYSKRKSSKDLFFRTKGVIEALGKELNLSNLEFAVTKENTSAWQQENCGAIILDGTKIGELGIINPKIINNFEIKGTITAARLNPRKLIAQAKKAMPFESIPQYPPVVEDLTIVAAKNTLVGDLKKTINSITENKHKNVTINAAFSETYTDEELNRKNKRAVTFNIEYRSPEKTLSDEEVKKIREDILNKLKKEHSAKLRN